MTAFAALSAVFLLTGGVIATRMSATQTAVEADEYSYRMLELSGAMMAALANQQDTMRGFVAKPDERFQGKYAEYGNDYASAATTFQAAARSEAEKADGARIGDLAAQFHQEAEQAFAQAHDPAKVEQARADVLANGRLHDIRNVVKNIATQEREIRGARRQAERGAFQDAMTALTLGCAVALAFAGLLAWALTRTVGKPVAEMSAAMTRLAAGDTAVVIPAIHHADEIGQMAGAIHAFKAAVADNSRLKDEAEAERQAAETEKTRHGAAREAAVAQQTAALQAIGAGLEKMAAGEMTFRLSEPFKLEIKVSAALYEKLRQDFNAAMDRLQEVMQSVVGSTSAIRSGAGEI
ncbi:HAMP domain-containing protein, partial [Caulobacter sp. S45]|uniref:HAMP domain-containing protein n=1 Tax=Caulobacter sp. S45 TaxID=1641861 RepID=UPI001C20759C